MSEIAFIILLGISIILLFLSYYFLDIKGLKILTILMTIISFLLSFKIVTVFNLDTNMNIIPYMTLLSLVYIFKEKYNKKSLTENIITIFVTSVITLIVIILLSTYIQSINDIVASNITSLFIDNYKVAIIYPIMLLGEIICSLKLYEILKKYNNVNSINIIITTITIGIIECVIFSTVSYVSVLEFKEISRLALSDYLFKLIIIIFFLPVINLIIKRKKVLE